MSPAGPLHEVAQVIQASIPTFPINSVSIEGEGDFCRAYTINGEWLFRFAYNAEGSRTLEREAASLARLASTRRDINREGERRDD